MRMSSETASQSASAEGSAWWAILAMMLGVASLIAAELLPVSMLTQIARELSISTGLAGQMISITALTAMITGLVLPARIKGVDRRYLILAFSALLVVSCLVTAAAPSFLILLAARIILGVAIGGFWAILTAVTMQLVPAHRVASAFSIIFSGVSLALVVAAPLGSYLGGLFGWRVVFLGVAAIACVVLALQWFTIPSVHREAEQHGDGMGRLLSRPGVTLAFLAMLLSFMGNQMVYIYLRPYMESFLGFGIEQISLSWVLFGIASFLGATFTGVLAERMLKQILIGIPVTMVVVSGLLLAGPRLAWLVFSLIACWGFFGAVLPIIWSTWITRALPDNADSAGGLYAAALQVAAMLGALVSGALIDHSGIASNLEVTGAVMVATVLMTLVSLRRRRID
ncbi:MFS transporter [Salinicola avicenniae]|uniref:MFS transporter n=1 Tax=Salinicola avicenniae TaxID=2916836 RepID=UPI002073981D|nr:MULTISPECIES: MFS transporter [unclassified Salinicola]